MASLPGREGPAGEAGASRFEDLGLVTEITGQRRSRRFSYEPYLRLFHTGVANPGGVPAPVTSA
jgi:hypothetical protein